MTEKRCARENDGLAWTSSLLCFLERQLTSIRSERKHPLRTRILFLEFLSGALKIPVKPLSEPEIANHHRSHHISRSQRLTLHLAQFSGPAQRRGGSFWQELES